MTRREKRKKKRLQFINYFIVSAILIIIFVLGIEEYNESKIKKQRANRKILYTAQNVSRTYKEEKQNKEETKTYPKEEIPEKYKGYNISAKLEIPKIDLETYILSSYSEKSLNISVTKFWGADPNERGNCCVAGHNAQNKNMFRNLRNLKIGETMWVTDNEIGKIEYEIYDIYTVLPEDVKCLSQETEGRREITLITCTNDSKKRIIVKAKEKID